MKDLVKMFPNSLMNIRFLSVVFKELWKLLSDREELQTRSVASFQFDSLTRTLAKTFISVLREKKLEFALVFVELNQKQAQLIINNADLGQEAIEINKVSSSLLPIILSN